MKFTQKRFQAIYARYQQLNDKILEVSRVYLKIYHPKLKQDIVLDYFGEQSLSEFYVVVLYDFYRDDYETIRFYIKYEWLLLDDDAIVKTIEDYKWESGKEVRERNKRLANIVKENNRKEKEEKYKKELEARIAFYTNLV